MTYKMAPRGSVGFFDFVQIIIWPKHAARDMRYSRTGRAGTPIREETKRKKISTYNDAS
jgi:hypothetical protein